MSKYIENIELKLYNEKNRKNVNIKRMGKMKNNKGIALITLSITIIVLLIIASVGIFYGKDQIEKAQLENIKTNMLLMQSKAKEYCEQANFRLGTGIVPENEEERANYIAPGYSYLNNERQVEGETTQIDDENRPVFQNTSSRPTADGIDAFDYVTELSDENLNKMGVKIEKKAEEKYYLGFDVIQNKVEVFYKDGTKTYSLTQLENI